MIKGLQRECTVTYAPRNNLTDNEKLLDNPIEKHLARIPLTNTLLLINCYFKS